MSDNEAKSAVAVAEEEARAAEEAALKAEEAAAEAAAKKAEAAAKASEEAIKAAAAKKEKEIKKADSLWKKDPDAQIRRVFRVNHWSDRRKPESLMTLMDPPVVVNGRVVEEAATRSLQATPARQFVLDKNALKYEKQLAALRHHETVPYQDDEPMITEVAPSKEGVLYIPPKQRKIAALKAELKTLGVTV